MTRSVSNNTTAAKRGTGGKSAPEGVVFSFRLLFFDKVIINSLILLSDKIRDINVTEAIASNKDFW